MGISEFHFCLSEEGGCSELVIYHVLPINWVITNSTSSMIMYISSNYSLIIEGAQYVYKHVHTVTKCHYTDIYTESSCNVIEYLY